MSLTPASLFRECSGGGNLALDLDNSQNLPKKERENPFQCHFPICHNKIQTCLSLWLHNHWSARQTSFWRWWMVSLSHHLITELRLTDRQTLAYNCDKVKKGNDWQTHPGMVITGLLYNHPVDQVEWDEESSRLGDLETDWWWGVWLRTWMNQSFSQINHFIQSSQWVDNSSAQSYIEL